MSYLLDGELVANHGAGYAPTAPMSINFNLWFDKDGLIDSTARRQYVEHVDWVFHQANTVLTTEEVELRVAELRGTSVRRQDTVPDWAPAYPSLCDL